MTTQKTTSLNASLLSTSSALLMGVAAAATIAPSAAYAIDWDAYTTAQGDVNATPTADTKTLDLTLLGTINKVGGEAVSNTDKVDGVITMNMTNTVDGISSTGDFSTVHISGTGEVDSITLTKGTITGAGTTGGTGTIVINGAASSTAINIAADGVVSNTGAGGEAIVIGGNNAYTGTITNAGTISTTNDAGSIAINIADNAGTAAIINNTGTINAGALGTAISAGISQVNITNSGAGAITGAITLGTNAASTLVVSGGTVAGNVTFGNAAQLLTLSGGAITGNILAGTTGDGDIAVGATTVTNGDIGTFANQIDDITIADTFTLNLDTNDDDLYADAVTLNGATAGLTIGTGAFDATVDGGVAGQGILTLNGNNTITQHVGNTANLATVAIGAGVTIDAQTNDKNIKATNLTLGANSALTTDDGVIAVTNATLGNASTLTIGSGGYSGLIDGNTAGDGAVVLSETQTTNGNIGATNKVASVTVNNGATVTANNNITATAINVGNGVSGALTVASGKTATGIFTLDGGSTLTVAGDISGTVDGQAAGEGTLAFTADETLASAIGGTNSIASLTVADGAAVNSGGQNITATAMTVGGGASGSFTQTAGTVTTNAAVAAGGTYTQTGGGLTGNITIGTGGTFRINGGTGFTGTANGAGAGQGILDIDTDFTSTGIIGGVASLASIDVATGKVFTLGGNVSSTAITNNGTVNFGTVARTVTGAYSSVGGTTALSTADHILTGGFTANAASTLTSTINTATANDAGTLTASGTVAITNGAALTLNVAAPTAIVRGTTYDIVTGTGAHSGLVTITDNGAGPNLYFDGIQDTSATGFLRVFANLETPFASHVTATGTNGTNLQNVATALQNINTVTSGHLLTYLQRLDTLFMTNDDAGLAAALDEVIVQADSSSVIGTFNAVDQSTGMVGTRLAALRTPGSSASLATGLASGQTARDRGLWVQGFGTTATQDQRDGIAGFDADTYGVAVGADKQFGNKVLGVSLSYANTNVDSDDTRKTTDIDSYQANLYGSYNRGQMYIDGLAGYALHQLDSSRRITTPSVVANGDYDANTYIAKVDAGYTMPLRSGFDLTPNAGVHYASTGFDSYTETGAGTLGLNVNHADADMLQSKIGLNLGYTHQGATYSIRPVLRVAYLHDFANDAQSTTSSFTGGGATFTTNGLTQDADAFTVGAGLNLATQGRFSVTGDYEYEMREDYDAHSGLLRARLSF